MKRYVGERNLYPAKLASAHTDCFFPISVSKCRFGGKIISLPNILLLTTASCQTYFYSQMFTPNLLLLTTASHQTYFYSQMCMPNLLLLPTVSRQTYIYSHTSKCRFVGKIIFAPNLHLLTTVMVFFCYHSYLRKI